MTKSGMDLSFSFDETGRIILADEELDRLVEATAETTAGGLVVNPDNNHCYNPSACGENQNNTDCTNRCGQDTGDGSSNLRCINLGG